MGGHQGSRITPRLDTTKSDPALGAKHTSTTAFGSIFLSRTLHVFFCAARPVFSILPCRSAAATGFFFISFLVSFFPWHPFCLHPLLDTCSSSGAALRRYPYHIQNEPETHSRDIILPHEPLSLIHCATLNSFIPRFHTTAACESE